MSNRSRPQDYVLPPPTAERSRRPSTQSTNTTNSRSHLQQGPNTEPRIEQQYTTSYHHPSQSASNRPQQEFEKYPRDPNTRLVGQGNHAVNPAQFTAGSSTSHQPPQASRSTEHRPQQIHNEDSRRSTSQTHRQSVSESPVHGSSMTFDQSTSFRGAANYSQRQQPYDANCERSISQSPYGAPVSATDGNNSSTPSSQLYQASCATGGRSEQPYNMGPTSSNDQARHQHPMSDPPIRSSSLNAKEFVARGTDNDPQQSHDSRSAVQSHNYHSSSGQPANNPPMRSYHPSTRSMSQTHHHQLLIPELTTPGSLAVSYQMPQTFQDMEKRPLHYHTGPTAPIAHMSHASGSHTDSPSNRPSGDDLTGRIKVLSYPGKTFTWQIGTGAFTDVFKGTWVETVPPNTPKFVAVKLFRASTEEDPDDTAAISRRLIRESNVWLGLSHRNIQPYIGHCSDLGLAVALISPLRPNGHIMKYLAKHRSTLAVRERFVKDVAEGLQYLHSKDIIHADLHPKNILVDDEGCALLTDFGRAKIIGKKGFSTAFLAGCAQYMSPELLTSEPEVNVDALFSRNSDVYAFAMVCFEILTSLAPFASYNLKGPVRDIQVINLIRENRRPQHNPDIPDYMWEIMQTCWKNMPSERLSTDDIVQRLQPRQRMRR